MVRYPGEEKLKQSAETDFPKGVTRIASGVFFIHGYGASQAVLIETKDSCVLIDTLNGKEFAEEALIELRKITEKPIKTIIYTHYLHTDHTSGAAVFAAEGCEVIAHTPAYPQYTRSAFIKGIAGVRGARQFGAGLTPEESISLGIGPLSELQATVASLKPTRYFSEPSLTLTIGGTQLVLTSAPGETDDQLFVWLPQTQVLCCGDNYYNSWPNLYAIRGGQYRDVSQWVNVLDAMIALEAEHLLPGHTQAISGKASVKVKLTAYRDAIQYILEETLKGMDRGLTADQLADSVKLPEDWATLPNLQEYYGTVEWTVRSIFSGYLGWFDGNPTKLGSLPVRVKAEKMVDAMGGAQKVFSIAKQAIESDDDQWGVELCDFLLDAGQMEKEAGVLKAEGLIHLGRMQTSANGRHYYLSCAKQQLGRMGQQTMTNLMMDIEKKAELS